MAKLDSVCINIRRWTRTKDKVMETLILECLPTHYGWEAAQKAYYYAQRVLKSRWTEGEKIILKTPRFAYLYAKNVIKGRWKEAEKFIAKDEYSAYYYSKFVLKGRFPEFEDYLQTVDFKKSRWIHDEQLVNYARFFLNSRLPKKVEKRICERPHSASEYAIHVLKKRWKAAEKNISKSSPGVIDNYIRSLSKVKERRDFRVLLLAEAMTDKKWTWNPAARWFEENEKSSNPVTF